MLFVSLIVVFWKNLHNSNTKSHTNLFLFFQSFILQLIHFFFFKWKKLKNFRTKETEELFFFYLKITLNVKENTCNNNKSLAFSCVTTVKDCWDYTKRENKNLAIEKNKKFVLQVFSYELCKICKNTFFTEHLQETASLTQLWMNE